MVLVIYVHPQTPGHGPVMLEELKKALSERKEKFEILDLYKIKYDPVLHENEHYTSGGREISKQNKDIQKKISKEKKLIFLYPVWWYSMPAMLKGFLDRILTARFAFTYKGAIPVKLLKGKKARVLITTGAPSWAWFLPGIRAAKLLTKEILQFCGIKTKVFCLHGAQRYSEDKLPKIRLLIQNALRDF
ncbi:flavodoxin family protein [Candidatus Woesearchaeota archaeon]|nr:flavodoxin family protein [Candidatus Woesearchaeota archaeon]